MTDDAITIEVNGRPLAARKGQMLIEVTDANDIYVPRFCYHKKLTVAANCRMCLVEVEKAPKTLPACATPVNDGMKVFTRSKAAIDAQKAVMEFLLINHPLDCPICDQGGECELQDLAMGYGSDVSRFTENKRVVKDKNIGPLVQTDMTRCIHCTRCVRFGQEIAGLRELGATGRGEHMEIGTYVEKAMTSELSGNVIDLCPVGALTNKPFRYSARTWEMQQRRSIAPHDSVGSNIFLHIKGDTVKRVVPAENENINEVWLSDRDRYSYEGLNSSERLHSPLLKRNGEWQEVDWEVALAQVHDRLQAVIDGHGADAVGGLAAPWSTTEELYLFQKLLRGIGVKNIDHRLRQQDMRGPVNTPLLGCTLPELERLDAVLLIGSYVRKEQPLINHRLRKAALRGANIMAINSAAFDFNYDLAVESVVKPGQMIYELAAVARALTELTVDQSMPALLREVTVNDKHRQIATALYTDQQVHVLLGAQAALHPDYSLLAALTQTIAKLVGATSGCLPLAANAVGAVRTNVLPDNDGLSACNMLSTPRQAYVLMGLEPDIDCADGEQAMAALTAAESVIAISSFRSTALLQSADVILPMAQFAETAGSFVNITGAAQAFTAAVNPPGMSRPAWKILRVLGNLFDLPGFDYQSVAEVAAAAEVNHNSGESASVSLPDQLPATTSGYEMVIQLPMNSVDPLVRHANALQQTPDAADGYLHLAADVASDLKVHNGARVTMTQGNRKQTLPVLIDTQLAAGCFAIQAGHPDAMTFAHAAGAIVLAVASPAEVSQAS
ncbi:MAG: NADH-quinone oxidoreductase subunit NuoG [Gammaproteobacteria bacterium]